MKEKEVNSRKITDFFSKIQPIQLKREKKSQVKEEMEIEPSLIAIAQPKPNAAILDSHNLNKEPEKLPDNIANEVADTEMPSEKVQSTWKLKYPNIIFDFDEHVLKCQYCIDYVKETQTIVTNPNARTFLDGTNNFKTTTIEKHNSKNVLHLQAVDYFAEKGKTKISIEETIIGKSFTGILDLTNEELDKLVPIFRNIYFMSKKDLPMRIAPDLHELVEIQGIKTNPNYRNHVSAREIMLIISEFIREGIYEKLNKSAFVGACFDESTDISIKQLLTISINYCIQVKIEQNFLCLKQLQATIVENYKVNADLIY